VISQGLSHAGIVPQRWDRQISLRTREGKTTSVVYCAAPIVNGTPDMRGMVIIFRKTNQSKG
jgi:hypothetical protein